MCKGIQLGVRAGEVILGGKTERGNVKSRPRKGCLEEEATEDLG